MLLKAEGRHDSKDMDKKWLKIHIPLDEPLFVQNVLVMSSGICKGKPGKDQNSSV